MIIVHKIRYIKVLENLLTFIFYNAILLSNMYLKKENKLIVYKSKDELFNFKK